MKAEQFARLQQLVESEDEIRRAVREHEQARERRGRRLIAGSTPALASSRLQTLVRRYAGQSNVRLDRIDAVGEPQEADGGLFALPVGVTGRGDVYGLVDLLFYLQHGEKLLIIDELSVSGATQRRDSLEMLDWTMRLHGLYAGE